MSEEKQQWSDWVKAGQITAEALQYGKKLIKPEVPLIDVCKQVEQKIRDLGGIPAFPAQISMNEIAAHYCPEDEKEVFSNQLVSLDAGTHVNGAIGDSAITVDLSGQYADLIKAAQDALKAVLKEARIGSKISTIGKVIDETIQGYGYMPVKNLSGHGLGVYEVHTTPTIPNFDTGQDDVLEEGMTIAIEPFATTGAGVIHEQGESTIFSLMHPKPVRLQLVRDVMKYVEQYQTLPFTNWWLYQKFSRAQVRLAINQLNQIKGIESYPPLVEINKGMVSQAEHSIIILEKPIITTKISE